MKEESQVALGFIIGSIAAFVYNKYYYHEGAQVKINGERIHHGEFGLAMLKRKDPIMRGIGLAFAIDDIGDAPQWSQK